jgi:hypothetical protein
MIAGVVPHPTPVPSSNLTDGLLPASLKPEGKKPQTQTLTSFLVIAYIPPEAFDDTDEMTDDRRRQARKAAERPEMRIISRAGEELAADALSITDYQHWGCNDYTVVEVSGSDDLLALDVDRSYVVMSPRDLVRVLPRDRRDHIAWLVERGRYEEALTDVEKLEAEEAAMGSKLKGTEVHLSAQEIGQKYIEHLVQEGNVFGFFFRLLSLVLMRDCFDSGDFVKAAKLCPKVCAHDPKRWENWIFAFAQRKQLQVQENLSFSKKSEFHFYFLGNHTLRTHRPTSTRPRRLRDDPRTFPFARPRSMLVFFPFTTISINVILQFRPFSKRSRIGHAKYTTSPLSSSLYEQNWTK